MTILNLMVYRHSAFYSPILSAIAGGFLAHEGFEPTYAVMPRQQKKLGVEFASELSRLNGRALFAFVSAANDADTYAAT